MYSAKLVVLDKVSREICGEHTVSGAKSPEVAYMAASTLYANIEREWPENPDYEITVYNDGQIVDKAEYADYFKIELFIDGESQGFIDIK